MVIRTTIEEKPFSLSYSADREVIGTLSDAGKVFWFKRMMDISFINPLKVIWDKEKDIFETRAAGSSGTGPVSFDVALFVFVLSGVEVFGSFVQPPLSKDALPGKEQFKAYISKYMIEWDIPVILKNVVSDLSDILWDDCRQAFSRGFCLKEVSLGSLEKDEKFNIVDYRPTIDCYKFFKDFCASVDSFYSDIERYPAVKETFLGQFRRFYP